MAYRHAIEAGIYLATLDDSMRELKRGNFDTTRTEQEQLELERRLQDRIDQDNGRVKRGIRRQANQHRIVMQSALSASISAASAKLNQQAQKTIAAKLHKLTYHKALRPLWKNLARFRTLTTFTPHQMRQFFYGVALTMHLFTNYNKRAIDLNQQLRSVFLMVFLPFAIPPMIVVGIPTLLFLIPLLIVITAFTALNRQAKVIMELNKPRPNLHRGTVFGSVSSKAYSSLTLAGSMVGDGIRHGGEFTYHMAEGLGESLSRVSERSVRTARRGSRLFRRAKSYPQTTTTTTSTTEASIPSVSNSTVTHVSTLASSSLLMLDLSTGSHSSSHRRLDGSHHSYSSSHRRLDGSHRSHSSSSYRRRRNSLDKNTSTLELVSSFESQSSEYPSVLLDVSNSNSNNSMVDSTPRNSSKHTNLFAWWRTSSNDTPTTEPSTASLRHSTNKRRNSRRNSFSTALKKATSSRRAKQQQRRVSFAAVEDVRRMERTMSMG